IDNVGVKFLLPFCMASMDIFNSVVAALFLLIVSLFAVIIKTNHGTLAGGVSRNVLISFLKQI
uniref:Uncharacterized protein n=1 Tax=Meleagris gallopavo TaxID=9103 RepID=A0A803YPN9_MELGA